MRSTLIGKMDGENIVVFPESHYIVTGSDPLDDDIVEILGRVYKRIAGVNIDITSEYCLAAGWYHPLTAIEKKDVL
jgi:hypothetical protein